MRRGAGLPARHRAGFVRTVRRGGERMARARLRLPDDLEHLTKDQMTRSIDQACLGIEDTLIAQQYLLDRLPQVDVAAEIGCDRSTISRRLPYIIAKVQDTAKRLY